MAHLATVGSHMVNGVSALHSQLLKDHVFTDFSSLWKEKYVNVTNGISPRRFLALSNPDLSALITGHIGEKWLVDLNELRKLEPLANDAKFQKAWRAIKLKNKERLAAVIEERTGVLVDPNMIFDIQVKRIHEYKRQLLMVLHILTAYLRHKKGDAQDMAPTAFIFSGKAAPGYFKAKLIIKLINAVGELVNNDRDLDNKMKVTFLPDFNVKNAQIIYPAADLSEQISMAGMEASGTGNMKFCLNGAITIGTLDGANVEIREEVGEDNFFLFGLNIAQVQATKAAGYRPRDLYENDRELQTVLDLLVSGKVSHGDSELFRPILDDLLQKDNFLVLADYRDYLRCQDEAHKAWKDEEGWTRRSILNATRMGKFSSDRSVQEYADMIWKVGSIKEK
ncbi:MAG: glycogen/starch/alpha-glucan phosphorylase, partial [Bacteroidota bacterium]|nr:glycogen/starch/alpha-glucan phosphorylase [Bacteroidota bacterium]